MAKTRAQRKAEQRRRAALQQGRSSDDLEQESRAQHDTQVGETADVIEAELAEHGADLDELTGRPGDGDGSTAPAPPAPSRADVGTPAEAAEGAAPPTRSRAAPGARRSATASSAPRNPRSAARRARRDRPSASAAA